jgi:glycosyltransferase involved in cell wall biosynthesis
MKNKITLVIPAKNEAESLPKVITELKKFKFKILIVLERTDRNTLNAIKNFKNLKIIYQKNKGYGDALRLGIRKVKTKYFCIFNADGSFNPREIKRYFEKIKNKQADIVFGSRYENQGKSDDDTFTTYVGNKIFTLIGKIFFNLPITDILYTYVLADTKKVNSLKLKDNDFKFCVELPIKAFRRDISILSCYSHERPRIAGKKESE